jgi:hypothetical protein
MPATSSGARRSANVSAVRDAGLAIAAAVFFF